MKVGFIGFGDMGQAIVPRLLAAGHEVTGWNRSKEKTASFPGSARTQRIWT